MGISVIVTAVAVVLLLILLIFPHELGHFLAAKACNVQVNEFAFGMGPALFQHQGKETLYSIRAIPIGGYCKMEGEDVMNESSNDDELSDAALEENPRAFNNKAWWQKIIILVAGAAMNFLIAILGLTIMISVIGIGTNEISAVQKGTPAYEAKLEVGDTLEKIDGNRVYNQHDILKYIQNRKNVDITLKREGKTVDVTLAPIYNSQLQMNVIGINLKASHNPLKALWSATKTTGRMSGQVFKALRNLFTADGIRQVSGPVGMVNMVSQANDLGWMYYVQLMALISVNLGLFNLLPLPALDGGRIIFVILRKLFGKAISERGETYVHAIGMVMLLGLMVYVTWNDILRLFN